MTVSGNSTLGPSATVSRLGDLSMTRDSRFITVLAVLAVLAVLVVSEAACRGTGDGDTGNDANRTGLHRHLLIVLDGLRPDYVTRELMPNLYALGQRGVVMNRHHAVYPTVTRVNASSISTEYGIINDVTLNVYGIPPHLRHHYSSRYKSPHAPT